MPGVKRKSEAVQLSTSKPAKKQKQPQPATLFKSAEYVVDSDSNAESPRAKPAAKKSATSSAKKSNRAPSDQVSTTRHTHPKVIIPQRDQSGKRRHESPVISSTSSDDSESSEGTGSEDEESEISPHQAKKGKENTLSVTDSQSSDDEEDDDDDEDEDESESDGSDESLDELDERRQQQHIESKSSSKPYKPTEPYKPPPGFEAANFTNSSSTSTSKLFTAEYLRRKEIWHITVPACVPIDSIKEVPIDKFLAGRPIMSYKGSDYGLIPEDEANQIEKMLLVPYYKDKDYRLARPGITRTLQLQQIVRPPPLPHRPGGAPNGTERAPKTHVKAVRQQPKGLKMRYRPFGDESSSDNPDAAPRFKLPPIVYPVRTSKKPEEPVKDARIPSPHKAKKQKRNEPVTTKPRRDSSSMLDLAWRSSFGPSSRATPDVPRKQQKDGDLPGNGKVKETSEEKAKRQEEKKRRKEGKDANTKDSTKKADTPTVSSAKKERKAHVLPVNGIANPSLPASILGQSASKKKPEKLDVVVPEAAAVTANGVDDAETVSKPSEPEKPKVKRRKRKTEITEDV
ncbi:MAG: hypothetical protein Q9194_004609 [Teloschistes cf. exilis]